MNIYHMLGMIFFNGIEAIKSDFLIQKEKSTKYVLRSLIRIEMGFFKMYFNHSYTKEFFHKEISSFPLIWYRYGCIRIYQKNKGFSPKGRAQQGWSSFWLGSDG
jgi:hypothetical protein